MLLTPKQATKLLALLQQGIEDAIAWARIMDGCAYLHRVGVRNGSSTRKYVCNGCGRVVDTESAKHSPTKHASEARRKHARECETWRKHKANVSAWLTQHTPAEAQKAAPEQPELDAGSSRMGEATP